MMKMPVYVSTFLSVISSLDAFKIVNFPVVVKPNRRAVCDMSFISRNGIVLTSSPIGSNASSTRIQSVNEPTIPPISNTSKRIFMVRHGEVINPGGDRPVYYGALDVPLSDLGKSEAEVCNNSNNNE